MLAEVGTVDCLVMEGATVLADAAVTDDAEL